MLGWARQLVQYYPLKSRILHSATVLSSYTMPARRTVASYMTDTADPVGFPLDSVGFPSSLLAPLCKSVRVCRICALITIVV